MALIRVMAARTRVMAARTRVMAIHTRVMAAHTCVMAGLGPATHVCAAATQKSRGWPRQARPSTWVNHLVGCYNVTQDSE